MKKVLGVVLGVCATGCASGCATPTPRAPAPVSTPAPPPKPFHAKLLYEIRGHAYPLPIVRGTVNGTPTSMLVDTGANAHIVAGWFARKLGLPLNKLESSGSDHLGRAVASYRIDDAKLAIDGWGTANDGPVLAMEVSEVLERLGVGVFVSPQHLALDGQVVVLDLNHAEMRAESANDVDVPVEGPGRSLIGEANVHTCADPSDTVDARTFVVSATVDGQEASLLLDTGARRTDLFTTSKPGKALFEKSSKARDATYTASGTTYVRKLRGAKVVVGEVDISTDVDLMDGTTDAICPRDGVLAMDVLRACTLVFDEKGVSGRCDTPRTP